MPALFRRRPNPHHGLCGAPGSARLDPMSRLYRARRRASRDSHLWGHRGSTNTMSDDADWIRLKAAEKLGWREVEYSRDGYLVGHGPGRKDIKVVPSYARDTRAAWEIVETLIAAGADVKVGSTPRHIKEYAVEIRMP